MKKTIWFLLWMVFTVNFAWGQQTMNEIIPSELEFPNLKLEKRNVTIQSVGTSGVCSENTQIEGVHFLYFKAEYALNLQFEVRSQSGMDNFAVFTWILNSSSPKDVFNSPTQTIRPIRQVYGKSTIKGLNNSSSETCRNYPDTNGFVKPETVIAGQMVVIAIMAPLIEKFDLELKIAKFNTINDFVNQKCSGDNYTYQNILDKVKEKSGLNDVTLYSSKDFKVENIINAGTIFSANQIIYAQVKDATGSLMYVYEIPIQFIKEHEFNFKNNIDTEYACSTTYTIPSKVELLNKLFNTVDVNYSISSIVINRATYLPGDTVNLAIGEKTEMKIKVYYGGTCPIDSNEVSIPIIQGSPELSGVIDDTTCTTYTIDFDKIYSKLGKDKNDFNVIVTLNGVPVLNGQSTSISSPLTYKVKIQSKTGGGCVSNEIDFIVTKTSPADILPAEIKNICLADFSPTNVDNAIATIQNGNLYNLKFYQSNGTTEISRTDLFNYIKTNKTGKIIIRALAADNGNSICDTETELKFNLSEPEYNSSNVSFQVLYSTCSEIGNGFIFSESLIKEHLKNQFGRVDLEFQGISETPLNDNQDTLITFRVKPIGDLCWSEELKLKLQVVTKPNVQEAIKELQADCNDLITINDQVLSELFGANTINTFPIQVLHNNKTPLNFDINGKAEIKVLFNNIHDNACVTEKIIVVNKKQDLVVDTNKLEADMNKVVYCEDNHQDAKNQIQANLAYIKTQYSALISSYSVDEIFNKFTSDKGFVEVPFTDPNFCGDVKVKFYYQKNTLPPFDLPTSKEVCSDEKYSLDFEALANEKGVNVADYKYEVKREDGTIISGIYKYELGVGNYTISISDKNSGCPKVYSLKVGYSEVPVIKKITINEKSVVVSATGKGKLEYALFDKNGDIVVDWQSNNTLIIPTDLSNNNFTVKVRLNKCGVTIESDIIYLSLPNFISPNNDEKNDKWKPMTSNGKVSDDVNSYKLIIFDRTGKQILSKEGKNIIEWDGTYLGKPVLDGTYWYLLEASTQESNREVQYSGYITVKRKAN